MWVSWGTAQINQSTSLANPFEMKNKLKPFNVRTRCDDANRLAFLPCFVNRWNRRNHPWSLMRSVTPVLCTVNSSDLFRCTKVHLTMPQSVNYRMFQNWPVNEWKASNMWSVGCAQRYEPLKYELGNFVICLRTEMQTHRGSNYQFLFWEIGPSQKQMKMCGGMRERKDPFSTFSNDKKCIWMSSFVLPPNRRSDIWLGDDWVISICAPLNKRRKYTNTTHASKNQPLLRMEVLIFTSSFSLRFAHWTGFV